MYVLAILSFRFELNYIFILSVCFLALIPLEKLFDFGGEQLAMYCGEDLGDLIVVTLNKYVRVSPSLLKRSDTGSPVPWRPLLQSSFSLDASTYPLHPHIRVRPQLIDCRRLKLLQSTITGE